MRHVLDFALDGFMLDISDEPGPDFQTTSGIQKGLILWKGRRCLVQEGIGFGAPILAAPTETFFSKTASIRMEGPRIIKRYSLDCVPRIVIGQKRLENPAMRYGFEGLVGLYMRLERLQPFLLGIQKAMARSFNGSCRFVVTRPAGTVTVSYEPGEAGVRIEARLATPIEGARFVMANEQGADIFDRAVADGRRLRGSGIGGWIAAKTASLWSSDGKLELSVRPPDGTRLFIGREKTGYLSWAGIELQTDERRMEYELELSAGPVGRRERPGSRQSMSGVSHG